MPANRPKTEIKGRFKKGQSGNPSGRPPIPDAFKAHVKDAEDKILELMQSDDENVALRAASLVLAYVKGKPTEHVEMSVSFDRAEVMRERIEKLKRGS